MKRLTIAFLVCAPLFWGCTSQFTAARGNDDHVFEEMRTEIAELRHALHGTEVELRLLEEKLEAPASSKDGVAALQRKITALEKTVESLMAYANQNTASLSAYRDQIARIDQKLDEIAKLRSTLTQISKNYAAPSTTTTYQVKSGDSLEKIARKHNIPVEALKRENQLSSDKIFIGQELKIPHE